MKQEVIQTSAMEVNRAVTDIVSKLSKPVHEYNVIIFFAAAEYDFPALAVKIKEYFPKAEVLGASAPGEITPKGFIKRSLVVTALSCSKTSFQAGPQHEKRILALNSSSYIQARFPMLNVSSPESILILL